MAINITLPPSSEVFRPTIESSLREWCRGATLRAREMHGGMSGASVLRVDLSDVLQGDVPPGQYILKLRTVGDAASGAARRAHERTTQLNIQFAEEHLPVVVREHTSPLEETMTEAVLLTVAGGSLRRYQSCSRPDSPALLRQVARIVSDIYRCWLQPNSTTELTATETITAFMTERRLRDAIRLSKQLSSQESYRITPSGLLVWPHTLFSLLESEPGDPETVIHGFNHRDLHGGNILIQSTEGEHGKYCLIDLDESDFGPFCFDLAYLEVERFIRICNGVMDTDVSDILSHDLRKGREESLPGNTAAFRAFRKALHDAEAAAWQASRWEDSLSRQSLLARISAALTWLRRPSLSRTEVETVHLYAAVCCSQLLTDYFPNLLSQITQHDYAGKDGITDSHPDAGAVAPELARAISELGLSGGRQRLVLITEALTPGPSLSSLGLVPWDTVIDLDPTSAESGLFHEAAPNLEARRAIHRFSRTVPRPLARRGCAWMFANGWRGVGEPILPDRDWIYTMPAVIRELGRDLRGLVGDSPTNVVVLATSSAKPFGSSRTSLDRLSRTVEALDEAFEGSLEFHCIGFRPDLPHVRTVQHTFTTPAFVESLAHELGTTTLHGEILLPTEDGFVEVLASIAAGLSETFELLHRGLPGIPEQEARSEGDFRRGSEPSWNDLSESEDVARDIYSEAISRIAAELESRRTRTVVLNHNPSAGGSSFARRLGWDLHLEHPVCLLRRDEQITPNQVALVAERLRVIFSLTGKPVLCIAEASSLPESAREQLYRVLTGSGTRVVLLYIRRTFQNGSVSKGKNAPLALLDPISEGEAKRFAEFFKGATDDVSRHAEIVKLTRPEYVRYRSPFFFGLAAFGRDFQTIESYVSHHIGGVLRRRRDVLEYLAFVTAYTDVGMELNTIQRLLGLEPRSGPLELEDLFGDSVARLLSISGARVRVAHPILAEEILDELIGGGVTEWRRHGHEIAAELIRDLGTLTDTTSVATRDLLRLIFVERPGVRFDDVDDRLQFAPIIESLDETEAALGHRVLRTLTEFFPDEAHFWTHLGRHQIYRMNRDFSDAVGYVEHAIALAPGDPVHHHMLGQVHRFIVRDSVRHGRKLKSAELLERIRPDYNAATQAFTESRMLAPDNIYGYITHIQTTIEAARALKTADHVSAVADLENDEVQEWVREELSVVNGLADEAAILYSTLDDSDGYLQRCLADLQQLYGDLDRAIEIWELASDGSGSTPYGRRSLAQTYLVRAERRWSRLTDGELARIVDLMARNMRAPRPTDEDFRLWFEAYRLIDEFDMDDALANLAVWNRRTQGWRPNYYSYVLQFLLWFSGRTDETADLLDSREASARLVVGRSKNSLLWLAPGPESCPLIGADELGEWDRSKNFWANYDSLRRINGVIDESIVGPQAGTIVIDGVLRAFFVPSVGGFSRGVDEGADVNFLLGFSVEGLRAWDVRRGKVPGGDRRRPGSVSEIEWTARPTVEPRVVDRIRTSAVSAFVTQLVSARQEAGFETTTILIAERLRAVFGARGLQVGTDSIEALIGEIPECTVDSLGVVQSRGNIDKGAEQAGDARSRQRVLEAGKVVITDVNRGWIALVGSRRTEKVAVGVARAGEFVVGTPIAFERTEKGDVRARTIVRLPDGACVFEGKILEAEGVAAALGGACISELERAASMGIDKVAAKRLFSILVSRFSGPGSLLAFFHHRTSTALMSSLPGIRLVGGDVVRVHSRVRSTVGAEPREMPAETNDPDPTYLSLLNFCDKFGEGPHLLSHLGSWIKSSVGENAYYEWRHGRALGKALMEIPGVHAIRVDEMHMSFRFDI